MSSLKGTMAINSTLFLKDRLVSTLTPRNILIEYEKVSISNL